MQRKQSFMAFFAFSRPNYLIRFTRKSLDKFPEASSCYFGKFVTILIVGVLRAEFFVKFKEDKDSINDSSQIAI